MTTCTSYDPVEFGKPLQKRQRDLIAQVRSDAVRELPVELGRIDQVNEALGALHEGQVTGRIVLRN